MNNRKKNKSGMLRCLILLTAVLVLWASCDVQYDAAMWETIINPKSDTTAPSNVTGLLAEEGDGSVLLSWINPLEADFEGVEVSASPAEGNLSSPVSVTAAETKYSVTGLVNGTVYSFTIKSRDTSSNVSTGVSVSATPVPPPDTTPPENVTELQAVPGNTVVVLTWTNPKDADFNGVEVSVTPASGNLATPVILTKDAVSYTANALLNDTTYTFSVKSLDLSQNKAGGATVSATPVLSTDTTPPANITGLTGAAGNASIVLTWQNPADEDFAGVAISASPAEGSLAFEQSTGKTTSSYTVTGLQNGTAYVFTLKSFDSNLNRAPGEIISATPKVVLSNLYNDVKPYKLSHIVYEFGGISGNKVLSLTNKTSSAVSLSAASINPSTHFSITGRSADTLAVGESGTITVNYSPSGSVNWDEAELTVGSEKVILTGSGYTQPSEISGLLVWLRADHTGSADVIPTTSLVRTLTDASPSSLTASITADSLAPAYNPVGINSLPTLQYKGSQFMVIDKAGTDPILASGAPGVTAVIVCKPTSIGARTILSAGYGGGISFPDFSMNTRYYDEDGTSYGGIPGASNNGYGTYRYGFRLYSLVSTGQQERWVYDDEGSDMLDIAVSDTVYNTILVYNSSLPLSTSMSISCYMNGVKKGLGYIYSRSSGWTVPDNSTVTTYGAYGKPIGDGLGNRHEGLGNNDIAVTNAMPSALLTKRSENDSGGDRAYDYRYSLNPGHSYLTNRFIQVSNTTVIRSLVIGQTQTRSESSTFYGELAEVILFSRALTDDEIKLVNNYVYYRYGAGALML